MFSCVCDPAEKQKSETAYIEAVASVLEESPDSVTEECKISISGNSRMSHDTKQVIVFGATGVIGTELVRMLSGEHPGWSIRAVTRDVHAASNSTDNNSMKRQKKTLSTMQAARLDMLNSLPNVEWVQVDVLHRSKVLKVCHSCDIIFCCIGLDHFQKSYWAKNWPLAMENLLEATGSHRKLVFCDNLYAYGAPSDEAGILISPKKNTIASKTTQVTVEPTLKTKFGIRATVRRMIEEHMHRNPGTVTVIGASDFFGPYVTNHNTQQLGDWVIGKICKNESPAVVWGSFQAIHDFCYAPDLAYALATAAVRERAYDRFWICPNSIQNRTMQDIADDIARMAGKPWPVTFQVIPKIRCTLLSPFNSKCREMVELMPLYTKDYCVDDADFMHEFGIKPTPYEQALRDTVDFYLTHVKNQQILVTNTTSSAKRQHQVQPHPQHKPADNYIKISPSTERLTITTI